ncbi:MAG: hypothetical protein KAT61_03265, partial [Gammaproteobacteria bacterium]|nr:hypothetical protein [Gammaproteobacteria bacterium]
MRLPKFNLKYKKAAIFFFVMASLALTGCDSGEGASTSAENTNAKVRLSSAQATSNHYLAVTLDGEITQDALDELSFSIIASNGDSLAINQISLGD